MQDTALNKVHQLGLHLLDFLNKKIDDKVLTVEQVCSDLGIGKPGNSSKAWSDYAYSIKRNRIKVNVEHLVLAKELYGYQLSGAFGESTYIINHEVSEVQEDAVEIHQTQYSEHIAHTISSVIEKHKLPKEKYSETRLNKSRQSLDKIMRGQQRVFMEDVVRICEDTGESLDLFRTTPLPKGHMLTTIRIQEMLIESQKREIEMLRQQLQKSA